MREGFCPGNRAEPLPILFFKDYAKGSDRSPSGHEHACITLSTPILPWVFKVQRMCSQPRARAAIY